MKTVKVNLTDKAFDALEAAQYSEVLSATDVINRAIVIYSEIASVRTGKRMRLKILNGDRSVWRVITVKGGGAP